MIAPPREHVGRIEIVQQSDLGGVGRAKEANQSLEQKKSHKAGDDENPQAGHSPIHNANADKIDHKEYGRSGRAASLHSGMEIGHFGICVAFQYATDFKYGVSPFVLCLVRVDFEGRDDRKDNSENDHLIPLYVIKFCSPVRILDGYCGQ